MSESVSYAIFRTQYFKVTYHKKILQLWILTLIMRFLKLTLPVKSLHLSGLLKSDCVSILDSVQRLSHGPQLRERDFLLPRDINLGRSGTRDLRRHQETKLHKHSEKDGVGYCLYSQKKMVWGTASTVRKRWCGCTASTVRKRWCGVLPLPFYFGP